MTRKYKNSVIIDNEVVVKKNKHNNLLELFDYLKIRNFNSFPEILSIDDREIKIKYIESKDYHEMTKGIELIKTVVELHYKTLFFKDISKNKYRNVYDRLSSNIEYLRKYYLEMIETIESNEFMSPKEYLIARNYSIIDSSLSYSSKELKKWFKLVENKSKERVCTLHNNVSLKHFIHGDKNYLISWDNYMIDTPVLDLYKFYKVEGYSLDFNYLLKIYNENLELTKEEKLLLNILISIPPKIEFIGNELIDTQNARKIIDYIYSGVNVVNENK